MHFGGASLESLWQTILDPSMRGSYRIHEGARKHGVKRVIYASSVHAVGYHEVEVQIDVDAPVRPADRRMPYLSFADCVRLVEASLTAPRVGHTISFGISDNKMKTVDNSGANHLGFIPQDGAEPFREAIEANTPVLNPRAASVKYLRGWFCELGHPDDKPT